MFIPTKQNAVENIGRRTQSERERTMKEREGTTGYENRPMEHGRKSPGHSAEIRKRGVEVGKRKRDFRETAK